MNASKLNWRELTTDLNKCHLMIIMTLYIQCANMLCGLKTVGLAFTACILFFFKEAYYSNKYYTLSPERMGRFCTATGLLFLTPHDQISASAFRALLFVEIDGQNCSVEIHSTDWFWSASSPFSPQTEYNANFVGLFTFS